MAINADDEILQDFLIEAGEILEQLGEQLVDLEQQPEDFDLLNAVFRGFHTVKGGAGFLGIEALVEVCHRAEDVFNVLRQGQRSVDPALMDTVLQVLDVVNEMFALVREGQEPEPADQGLLDQLTILAEPDEAVATDAAAPSEDTSETEIESHGTEVEEDTSAQAPDENPAAEVEQAAGGDDITDDEFETLLDDLHGKGKFGGTPKAQSRPDQGSPSDEITDAEFEALLDQLHGKGKHAGVPANAETGKVKAQPKPKARTAKPRARTAKPRARTAKPKAVKTATAAKAAPKQGAVKPAPRKAQPAPAAQKPNVPAGEKSQPAPVASQPQAAAAQAKGKPATGETTVRVDTQRLDDIMNMVGELVLVRNRLDTLRASMNDEDVANAVGNLDVVTSDLQLAVMKTRMQPIKKVFGRFPRVMRDLARNLKKDIDLEMVGEDTDLDKNLVEALADPLVHLVRNSVDHGIELPDEREMKGKSRRGKVVLSAAQEGDHILLSISDDGKGMDPDVLRKKAVEKGMMDEEAAARLDDRDCYNLIFAPGFSTKKEISDVSGRGVGMDVVKTRISQMNGSVEIDSEQGKGSLITIKLPLTLAILPTLMVILGSQPFALPLTSVVEIFNLHLDRTNVVDGQLTIRVRDRALPLFYLRNWLVQEGMKEQPAKINGGGHVVVVNIGNLQVGLVVDYLVGQEEVVIKPLGALLQGVQGMAGATITGDGKIALILDLPGLLRKYARSY